MTMIVTRKPEISYPKLNALKKCITFLGMEFLRIGYEILIFRAAETYKIR